MMTYGLYSVNFQEWYLECESEMQVSHWYTGCSQLTVFIMIFCV